LVSVLVILHYLVILHVVVWDRLTSKHDQGVFVYHVQSNEPDTTVNNCVEDNPWISLDVQLLDGGSIPSGLISDSIDVSVAKSAAIRSSYRLLQTWQRLLLHCAYLKIFALLEILTFQRASDDIDKVLELGYSKINSIVHHLSQRLECLRGDIE
jgi:hypothetical protein